MCYPYSAELRTLVGTHVCIDVLTLQQRNTLAGNVAARQNKRGINPLDTYHYHVATTL